MNNHMFYIEFNVEGELVECLTEIEMHDDDMGIDRNIDRMLCPLKFVMLAHKIYNLTERTIIKDRHRTHLPHVMSAKEVFELSINPYIPFDEILQLMQSPK